MTSTRLMGMSGIATYIKLRTQTIAVFASLMLRQDRISALPVVSEEYSQSAAGVHSGKRLNQIINAKDIASIGLIENRGKGAPVAGGFRPQWNNDGLLRTAFAGKQEARDWTLSATGAWYARYALVTKKGDLYILDVLCDLTKGPAPTAILLHDRGFGCRTNLSETTSTEQNGGGQPAAGSGSK